METCYATKGLFILLDSGNRALISSESGIYWVQNVVDSNKDGPPGIHAKCRDPLSSAWRTIPMPALGRWLEMNIQSIKSQYVTVTTQKAH